jgi:hypothetical protein
MTTMLNNKGGLVREKIKFVLRRKPRTILAFGVSRGQLPLYALVNTSSALHGSQRQAIGVFCLLRGSRFVASFAMCKPRKEQQQTSKYQSPQAFQASDK